MWQLKVGYQRPSNNKKTEKNPTKQQQKKILKLPQSIKKSYSEQLKSRGNHQIKSYKLALWYCFLEHLLRNSVSSCLLWIIHSKLIDILIKTHYRHGRQSEKCLLDFVYLFSPPVWKECEHLQWNLTLADSSMCAELSSSFSTRPRNCIVLLKFKYL